VATRITTRQDPRVKATPEARDALAKATALYEQLLARRKTTPAGPLRTVRDFTVQDFLDYYDGKHNLAYQSEGFREAYGQLLGGFADNFMALVVDAVEERLHVLGFRFGTQTTGGTPDDPGAEDDDEPTVDELDAGDVLSAKIWQANNLDAGSSLVHTVALTTGYGYAMVQPRGARVIPGITVEDPRQVIAERDPETRELTAGIKSWTGLDGYEYLTLQTPTALWKWRSVTKLVSGMDSPRWTVREVVNAAGQAEQWPAPNPLGRVGIIEFLNRPTITGQGRSELVSAIPMQDALNKVVADLLVSSDFGAYRAWYATGVVPEDEKDPRTGEPTGRKVRPFDLNRNRVAILENPESKLATLDATDLGNIVEAVEMIVQHLASTSRTPPHYFQLGGGQPPSGESIASAESGLVAKAERRMQTFGDEWEELLRLALLAMGDPRAGVTDSETIWRDARTLNEAVRADATTKQAALGVPQAVLWSRLGYTPNEIRRMQRQKRRELDEAMAAADAHLTGAGVDVPVLPAAPPAPPALEQ